MLKIKECPNCKRTYSDESLSFCLLDGAVLSAPHNSNEFDHKQSLFDIEQPTILASKQKVKKLDVVVKHRSLLFSEVLENNSSSFDTDLSISFCRTLRIPDDGKRYPLPASLGDFPIYDVSDYADKVPDEWNQRAGVFIPMYQREAMFIDFHNSEDWEPKIVKIATGKINAITGEEWHQSILESEQDYVVVPPQVWLDGYKTGRNVVRQFVAMPLGEGYTVESQLSDQENFGGIQIIVFKPKEGLFSPPPSLDSEPGILTEPGMSKSVLRMEPQFEMGLGAGGRIEQKIYEDKYGVETWDENHYGRVYIHIVNSLMFKQITGLEPPETPIDAETYQKYELPWFEVYDEPLVDVGASEKLYQVKPIKLIDKIKNVFSKEEFVSLDIEDEKVKKINITSKKIKDGKW